MKTLNVVLPLLTAVLLTGCDGAKDCDGGALWVIESDEVIDRCAADFDIKYALYAVDSVFYVGYYDENHHLKVAKKDFSGSWTYKTFDEKVNWDSHRYISLAIDKEETIHLACNMHKDPLVYYRSTRSGDIASMERYAMTDVFEDSVTYPEFLQADTTLIFHYRNGRSGDGRTYFNVYHPETRTWDKLQDEPLFDGAGESNSYFKGPVLGGDGNFHLIWCWRDEPDCETNHGLYYAFSEDLKEWRTADGFTKTVPITPDDDAFLVDDIRVKEGLINGGFALGFDERQSPIIGYHKYDENDHTNLYTAVFEEGDWTLRRMTDWDWKWDFSGRGSIPFELTVDAVGEYDSVQYLYGSRMTDEGLFKKKAMKSFRASFKEGEGTAVESAEYDYPRSLDRPWRRGMLVHKEFDAGEGGQGDSVRYLLRYETLYPSRDKQQKKRPGTASSSLHLVKIRKATRPYR